MDVAMSYTLINVCRGLLQLPPKRAAAPQLVLVSLAVEMLEWVEKLADEVIPQWFLRSHTLTFGEKIEQ